MHRLLEGDAAREPVSWLLERVGLEPGMRGAIRTSFPAASGSASVLPARWRSIRKW